MGYDYPGDAHHQLVASYAADTAPYPTDSELSFPQREADHSEHTLLRELFFPRCWNATHLLEDPQAVRSQLAALGTYCRQGIDPYVDTDPTPIVTTVLDRLPVLRQLLKQDVEAAYKGDPAAKSYLEVIRSYPGIRAILAYRVAHEFYTAGAPSYARELTEHAKTQTGIDIHPGAEIGEYVFIDHGSGVVIGETATIGDWARIYQNVTLGALHFEKREDKEHMLKKGYKRHPDIGDHVVIGSGSNILGPVEIGDHVSIGANSWITEDVPPNTSVFVTEHPSQTHKPKQS